MMAVYSLRVLNPKLRKIVLGLETSMPERPRWDAIRASAEEHLWAIALPVLASRSREKSEPKEPANNSKRAGSDDGCR
jgi:hypothetical protein